MSSVSLALVIAAAGCQSKPPTDDPVDAGKAVDARVVAPRPDAPPGARACKRGVAYVNEKAADQPALSKGMGWWYNWSPRTDAAVHAALSNAGIEFVPMIWTGPPRAAIDVQGLIRDIPDDAQYLLGFNEPNFGNQANLTPEQAAAAWPKLEEIADARGLKLVSPALNYCGGNCNETDPFRWMDQFFAACKGCRIDYVAFHWYACSRDALREKLERFEAYGKPVWLTEFSCLDAADTSVEVQTAYMKDAVAVLEADPKVFRYSWFIGRDSPATTAIHLLGATGKLTPLGDTYVGMNGACKP